jgi:Skp family chaperone for outer membrane proteins
LISAVEKEKRTKTLQGQALKVKELEATINDFQRAARTQLDELRHQSRENILKEIQDFVRKKAKDKKVSLVLDTASETINQTPVILYNDDSNDWTQEILTSLNITAPPGVLKDSKPLDPK